MREKNEISRGNTEREGLGNVILKVQGREAEDGRIVYDRAREKEVNWTISKSSKGAQRKVEELMALGYSTVIKEGGLGRERKGERLKLW